jgi:hypothetical protein
MSALGIDFHYCGIDDPSPSAGQLWAQISAFESVAYSGDLWRDTCYLELRRWFFEVGGVSNRSEVLMRLRIFAVGVFVITFALLSGSAWADGISVQNGSFESVNPAVGLPFGCGAGCAYNLGPITGWTLIGTGGQFEPGGILSAPPDGSLVAFLNGSSSLSQDLGVGLVSGLTYALTLDVADRPGNADNYTIELVDGSTVLCQSSGATTSIPSGGYAPESCSFTATSSGGDLGILILGNGAQLDVDNVSVTVTTPEPASFAMLALGLFLAMVGGLYKRRNSAPSAA